MNPTSRPIYVEIRIRGSMDDLWRLTQTPDLHARWDLRFTDIHYLPRPDESEPQRFLYQTRIGFGLAIRGEGESVGSHDGPQGRTSVLKFSSADPKSLIREGAGYWKYIPTADGIRFFTQYDYQVRFGAAGRLFDGMVFRPLMGWATAWSFDRLRLWLERGVDPTLSLLRGVNHALARLSLAFIWIYQGLVPKLLFKDSGELSILAGGGLLHGWEPRVLDLMGALEILFGILFLLLWRARSLFVVNAAALLFLGAGAAFSQPHLYVAPFNPITLSLAMISLGILGHISAVNLPTAGTCLRTRPRGGE